MSIYRVTEENESPEKGSSNMKTPNNPKLGGNAS